MRQRTPSGACYPWRGSMGLLVALVLMAGVELAWPGNALGDVIEFLAGSRLEGTVTKIDKQARTVTFDAVIAGKSLSRTYPYDKIHAVTMSGKRYVLTEKSAAPSSATSGAPRSSSAAGSGSPQTSSSPKSSTSSGSATGPATVKTLRTRAEVEKLIDEMGKTPPSWFDSTPLDYPQTLDLDWPEKAPEGWNNQKNVGQYIWDIVNPNPERWRGGVRLLHHLLTLHKDDPVRRQRDMAALGDMYFRFFQDYPRAAFWWRQAKVQVVDGQGVSLAECYWRMGNRQMAAEFLKSRTLRPEMVKLLGDMGETQQAVSMADKLAGMMVNQGYSASIVHLHAGDACRLVGRYDDAVRYYEKVLDETGSLKGKVDQARKRAQANLDAIQLYRRSDVQQVADGSYRASSLGYEGDVEVEVTVRAHRIESVKVTQHKEKQFYSALTDVPAQILSKQGVKGVDATSKATITAEAILNASAKALAKGAEKP